MSKWEDSFRKTSIENNGSKTCHCSGNQGLFVPNRQLSVVVALLLLLSFSIFMTGYFLGKKKAVEQFTENMQQDAFADKIYTTVLSTVQENQSSVETALLVTDADERVDLSVQSINQEISAIEQEVVAQQQEHHYYAQLIGFGTEKSAQLFVKKLAAKGIETEVKKRISKTVKGHTSYWYQVVTAAYSNKNDVSVIVDRLAKEENIKDACIRVC
jgi:cell division protein FtsN